MLRDGVVLLEREGDGTRPHGQRLPADLMQLLDEVGVRVQDIDLFAVAAGPGSFTGLRVGIATVQGLAMAYGRAVVAVSTLAALAWSAVNEARHIGAWIDAHRGEVFAELYAPDGRHVVAAATVDAPARTLEAWASDATRPMRFIGDGAIRYQDQIVAASGDAEFVVPPPLAGIIGRLAARDPARAVVPHALVPIYVRRTDVELARERRDTQA